MDAEQRCVLYHVEHGKGSNLQHKDIKTRYYTMLYTTGPNDGCLI